MTKSRGLFVFCMIIGLMVSITGCSNNPASLNENNIIPIDKTLNITAIDNSTNNNIENVDLTIQSEDGEITGETDSNGIYSVEAQFIEGESYNITASHADYDEKTIVFIVDDSDDISVDCVLKDDFVITFDNQNLEDVIRIEIGKPSGDIYQSDVINIKVISASGESIVSIGGIQYLENLETLTISENQISDISPVSSLINLTNLNFNYNNVSDITSVSGLTNLTTLNFNSNEVSDISPLSDLTNLEILNFSNNNVSNITSVSGLTNLEELGIGGNQVNNIESLSTLTNLIKLNVSSTEVSDITSVSGLTNLEELSFSYNNVIDISPISNLTNLNILYFNNNSVQNISPISNLINLTTLHLGVNEVSVITPLSGLTNLKYLYINRNQIDDISALVDNTGINSGDQVFADQNYLDVTPGSDDMIDIQTLEDRGVYVDYDNQY